MSARDRFRAVQTALGVEPTGIPNDATKAAYTTLWDTALAEYRASAQAQPPPVAKVLGAAPVKAAPAKSEPAKSEPAFALGKIGADHWIEGAIRESFPGGKAMEKVRCVVIHFTSGATAMSSVGFWRTPDAKGANAHLVIARDGRVIQCRAFDRTCGHAGASRWRDPNTRQLYTGCNDFSIGIELANAGDSERVAAKISKLPLVEAKHRNGGPMQKWEAYPQAQLDSLFRVVSLLMGRYKLADITGHDCIAPERKNDPGPAFPMAELRKANGLSGLPEVHQKG